MRVNEFLTRDDRQQTRRMSARSRSTENAEHGLRRKIWLGRLDSNQRMAIPKTAALPLGYAPTQSASTNGAAFELQAPVCAEVGVNSRALKPPVVATVSRRDMLAHPSGPQRQSQDEAPPASRVPLPNPIAIQRRAPYAMRPVRSIAQLGRALSSGGRGRRFESSYSDQISRPARTLPYSGSTAARIPMIIVCRCAAGRLSGRLARRTTWRAVFRLDQQFDLLTCHAPERRLLGRPRLLHIVELEQERVDRTTVELQRMRRHCDFLPGQRDAVFFPAPHIAPHTMPDLTILRFSAHLFRDPACRLGGQQLRHRRP